MAIGREMRVRKTVAGGEFQATTQKTKKREKRAGKCKDLVRENGILFSPRPAPGKV